VAVEKKGTTFNHTKTGFYKRKNRLVRRIVLALNRLGKKALIKQENVQGDDEYRDQPSDQRRDFFIDKVPHQAAIARKQDERDERKGDAEGQNDLADDERPRRIHAGEDDGQRRNHRDQSPQIDVNAPLDETFHHDVARHRSHRGTRQAG